MNALCADSDASVASPCDWEGLIRLPTQPLATPILFFFGAALHDAIDWSVPPEFLEQEFSDVFTDNDPSKIVTDKIIRYRLKNGEK